MESKMQSIRLNDGRGWDEVCRLCQNVLTTHAAETEKVDTATYLERTATLCADPSKRPGCGELLDQVLQIYDPSSDSERLSFQVMRFVGNSVADTDVNRTLALQHLDKLMQSTYIPYLRRISIQVLLNLSLDFAPAQRQLAECGAHISIVNRLLTEDHNEIDHSADLELLALILNQEDVRNELLQHEEQSQSFFRALLDYTKRESSSLILLDVANIFPFEAPAFPGLIGDGVLLLGFIGLFEKLASHHSSLVTSISKSHEVDEDDVELKGGLKAAMDKLISLFVDLAYVDPADSFKDLQTSKMFNAGLSLIRDSNEDCATAGCLILGNVAHSDDRSTKMVREYGIHQDAIGLITPNAGRGVRHAAAGLLRNLAIPVANRPAIGSVQPIGGIQASITLLEAKGEPSIMDAALGLLIVLVKGCPQNAQQLVAMPQDAEVKFIDTLLSRVDIFDGSFRPSIARLLHGTLRGLLDTPPESLQNFCSRPKALQTLLDQARSTSTDQQVATSEAWLALTLLSTTDVGVRSLMAALDLNNGEQTSPAWDAFLAVAKDILEERGSASSSTAFDQALKGIRKNVVLLLSRLAQSSGEAPVQWRTEVDSVISSGLKDLETNGG